MLILYRIVGGDGVYGLGGQYAETKTPRLPAEVGATLSNDTNTGLRAVEQDNLTNFAAGTLE